MSTVDEPVAVRTGGDVTSQQENVALLGAGKAGQGRLVTRVRLGGQVTVVTIVTLDGQVTTVLFVTVVGQSSNATSVVQAMAVEDVMVGIADYLL